MNVKLKNKDFDNQFLCQDFAELDFLAQHQGLLFRVRTHSQGETLLEDNATHYICSVDSTSILLENKYQQSFALGDSVFACSPGKGKLIGAGRALIISYDNYKGLFSIGGPLEDKGRLKYINNCSDTLLVPPPKLGEPCLNALYFPANTVQTSHTHPSFRVGIVSSGAGFCLTQNSQYELRKGTVFFLPENTIHSFKTVGENSSLVVFAFHPDSDFGPTDENHPMINRTII